MSASTFISSNILSKKDSGVTLGIISLLFALDFAGGSSLFGLIVDHYSFMTF